MVAVLYRTVSLVLMVIVLLCMSFTTADTEEMEAMV